MLNMGTRAWSVASLVYNFGEQAELDYREHSPIVSKKRSNLRVNSQCSTPRSELMEEPPPMAAVPVHETIANIFWRSSLSFHAYMHGDPRVCFQDLWPKGNKLTPLLLESVFSTDLRQSVLDLCLLVLRCGPVDVLKILIDGKILDINQRFYNAVSMLHVACISRNLDAVVFLMQRKISTKLNDRLGRKAEDVCFCPRVRRALLYKYVLKTPPKDKIQQKSIPSLQERDSLFSMAAKPECCDELLYRLQMYEFNINSEKDGVGDCMIHTITRQGLAQLALLLNLVEMFDVNVDICNSDGLTPVAIAACSGDSILVDLLLCVFGVDPNRFNPHNNWTALHYAASMNHVDVTSVLLTRGADANIEDENGAMAEDVAAKSRASDSRELIESHRLHRVQSLMRLVTQEDLKPGIVKTTDLFSVDQHGRTLIMVAVIFNRCANLRILLEMDNCPINAQHPKTGRTALVIAANEGHVEPVKILLRYGADASIGDVGGYIALWHAVENMHLEVVETMLQFSKCLTGFAPTGPSSWSAQHPTRLYRPQSRQLEIVTPKLFRCSMVGDAESLYCLLEDGDNVNPRSGVGDWPMYLAAENGHIEVMKLLYERGGDVASAHASTRCTPLHVACARGHLEVVRYMLQLYGDSRRGSQVTHHQGHARELNINARNSQGFTAMQLAAEKGYSKIVKPLLVAGTTTALLDRSGNLYACNEYQGVQVLIETFRKRHSDEVMSCIRDRQALRQLSRIWQTRFDHNLRDRKGDTPLMVACAMSSLEIIKFLLGNAVYDVRDEDGSDFSSRTLWEDEDEALCSDSGMVVDGGHTLTSHSPHWLHARRSAIVDDGSSSDSGPDATSKPVKSSFHESLIYRPETRGRPDPAAATDMPARFSQSTRGSRCGYRPTAIPANVRKDFMTSTPEYSGPAPSRLQVLTQGLRNVSFRSSDTDEGPRDHRDHCSTGGGGAGDADPPRRALAAETAGPASKNKRQEFMLSLPVSVGSNARGRRVVCRDYVPERDRRPARQPAARGAAVEASWMWNPKQYQPRFFVDDSFSDRDAAENVVCRSQSTVARSAMYNLSGYFPNISHLNSSIFCRGDRISHVCGANPRDGCTPLQRMLEYRDSVQILNALLQADPSCVNIQNKEGLTALHMACRLDRKRVTEKLTSLPYIDLNLRTLDGKLPEEMTNNKGMIRLVRKAREMDSDLMSSLPSPSPSVSASTVGGSSIDFEKLNNRFVALKKSLQKK
ncbi:PREDICTED: uncharacterized protein LOC106806702 [Priapulus caudatus]|uniref:Uncharacterized protein LOC106806702 n=1 Tax=Priapulus caudatus TaxID=37621 RepID=A0ABM1DW82_PRICU|nr:PREDICTED: uncharacterized protein LOC106806702 [Priapulus caudatus]